MSNTTKKLSKELQASKQASETIEKIESSINSKDFKQAQRLANEANEAIQKVIASELKKRAKITKQQLDTLNIVIQWAPQSWSKVVGVSQKDNLNIVTSKGETRKGVLVIFNTCQFIGHKQTDLLKFNQALSHLITCIYSFLQPTNNGKGDHITSNGSVYNKLYKNNAVKLGFDVMSEKQSSWYCSEANKIVDELPTILYQHNADNDKKDKTPKKKVVYDYDFGNGTISTYAFYMKELEGATINGHKVKITKREVENTKKSKA